MSDSTLINIQAFQPFDGGVGVEFDATTAAQSAKLVPGTDGNVNKDKLRILVVNNGPASASIRMGGSGVAATTACTRIQVGTSVLLSPPFVSPGGVFINAICKSGTANLQITAGQGT